MTAKETDKPVTLIACAIFKEEAERLLADADLNLNIQWLEVGLHDNIERLEEILDGAIAVARRQGAPAIKLLYGSACLPEMKAFAKARGVAALPVKNCLAALVGETRLRELEQNHTLVASTGWVRQMWLGRAGTATGWTADDYRLQFGRYERILVLDPGLRPLTDEEIITCYDLVQVPLEVQPCDLKHFHHLFLELAGPDGTEKC
jgi:hypothetical protein